MEGLTRRDACGAAGLLAAAAALGPVVGGAAAARASEAGSASWQGVEHMVSDGQSLWSIQEAYGVPWEDIADANVIDRSGANDLAAGSIIVIPQDVVTSTLLGEADETAYEPVLAGFDEAEVLVPSNYREDVRIHAQVFIPAGEGPHPAVVINPGHSSSRFFLALAARSLASAGVAAVTMDYAGNGDSDEDWTAQCVTSMVNDSNDCLSYLLRTYDIDQSRLGILGHSMGSRVSCMILGTGDSAYRASVQLAPYVGDGDFWMHGFLGSGYETMEAAYEYARANGYWEPNPGVNTWKYAPSWFEGLLEDPCRGMASYKGSMLVVFGGQDTVVPQQTARRLIEACTGASSVRGLFVDVASHELGFPNGTPGNVSETVVQAIVDYFVTELA